MLVLLEYENIFFLCFSKKIGFIFKGKDAMGFDKILDVFYLWLDPEERRQSKI
jgi:hypothetical protein